jgi:ADP-ribosylglycohydrolase
VLFCYRLFLEKLSTGPVMDTQSNDRFVRACRSVGGLSVSDTFGERFCFHMSPLDTHITACLLLAPPWHHSDDTQMALSIVEILRRFGGIEQDHLARSFAEHFKPLPGIRGERPYSKGKA